MSLSPLVDLIAKSAATIEKEYAARGVAVPDLKDPFPNKIDTNNEPPTPALASALETLVAATGQIVATVQPPKNYIATMSLNFYEIVAMIIVTNASVPEILKVSPAGMDVQDIAKKVNLDPAKLGRLMRYLASRHIFAEVSENKFALNRASHPLLKDTPDSLVNLLGHFFYEQFPAASVLPETLTDPKLGSSNLPNQAALQKHFKIDIPVWEWFATEPERGMRFGKAMPEHASMAHQNAIAEDYPWAQLGKTATFVDVGGNVGSAAKVVADAMPQWNYIIQDRPEVVVNGKDFWKGSSYNVEFQPYDFFTPQPVKGAEVYFLRAIIHDWPELQCLQILEQIKNAASPTSRLMIVEYTILPATQQNGSVLLDNGGYAHRQTLNTDMIMMGSLNSQERSVSQFEALLVKAGFRIVQWRDVESLYEQTCSGGHNIQ